MARWCEPTKKQEKGWKTWVQKRPPNVRAVAERFELWSLYRMAPTGSRVTIASFGEAEDGTVTLTVTISAQFNMVMFERNVFGVNPDDLTPCELPAADEPLGAMMTPQDVDDNMDVLRQLAQIKRDVH